ncbi:hypothetical protein CDAR_176821 [Caerostris darwini]|uniref:Ribosomal protein S3 n=1 Tax=Caerostris darwini TaxID=1538125 RepID=A0AAV4RFL2_9ARAC|nr:hypothetical protein CDAR_176821 [Caerostris darwini]
MTRRNVFSDIFESPIGKVDQFTSKYGQKPFISKIYSIAEQKVLRARPNEFENEIGFSQYVIETRNAAENLIERFEKMNHSCSIFLQKFPVWSGIRRTAIEKLNKCADAIVSDRRRGLKTKLIASSAGIVGS